MTLREHLVEAAKVDPSAARELAGPPLPPLAATAWRVFQDVHETRPIGAQGITPVSYVELDAYCRLTETTLTPLDVHLVRVIDTEFVASTAAAMAPTDDSPPPLPAP
jgi:hypothetical protein